MSKKRKPREATEVDFSEPIDITKIGSTDDPCFGKLYDLSTEECRRCGDSELCALVFAQTKLKRQRAEMEKKNRYKDLELEAGLQKPPVNETLLKWLEVKKREGYSRGEVIKIAKKTFGTPREEIKALWNKIK